VPGLRSAVFVNAVRDNLMACRGPTDSGTPYGIVPENLCREIET
jgi:hypothetical protein